MKKNGTETKVKAVDNSVRAGQNKPRPAKAATVKATVSVKPKGKAKK